MKNFLIQCETEEENQKIADKIVDRKVVDKVVDRKVVDKVVNRKFVDKKSSNLVGVLKRKTDALCVRLQLREIGLKRLWLKLEK